MFTWEDFRKGINQRFVLPLSRFSITCSFPKKVLDTGSNLILLGLIRDAVVSVVRDLPDIGLQSISTQPGSGGDRGDVSDEHVYATVACQSPVYDFIIGVTPTQIQVAKGNCSLQNLVLTLPIIAQIVDLLIPIHETPGSLVDAMQVRDEIYRVEYRFDHQLSVQNKITDEGTELSNIDLMKKMIVLDLPSGESPEYRAPLAALNADLIRRGDMTLAFEKELAGRTRTMWINFEGPWNVTQRDFDFEVFYRMGEGNSTFELGDVHDFDTPFIEFYRDLMLKRLLSDLVFDMNIVGR